VTKCACKRGRTRNLWEYNVTRLATTRVIIGDLLEQIKSLMELLDLGVDVHDRVVEALEDLERVE